MIAIVDYGVGNIRSVERALVHVGAEARLTADPEVAVSVILPEIVVSGWSRALHNQRALYLKRLLLFEPRVILSAVPYQLG